MKKILLLFLCIAFCRVAMLAQDAPVADSIANEEYSDSAYAAEDEDFKEADLSNENRDFQKPTLRLVSKDSIWRLRKEEGFEYLRYVDSFYKHTKPKVAVKQGAQDSESGNDRSLKDGERPDSVFEISGIRYLVWGLALLGVLFVLYRLFASNSALFTRNRKASVEEETDNEVPITTDNINTLIEMAIRDKDYLLAIRLLYMQTIASMGEKQLLLLSPQKTNYQYVQELNGNPLQQAFSKLTMQYEYAWFGKFPVSAAQFETIHTGYKDFKSQL